MVRFLVADAAVEEARPHLPGVLAKRGFDPGPAMAVLDGLVEKIEIIEADVYGAREIDAKQRLINRDVKDWPIAAVALTWTEDADFFGIGIATWTTDRVEIYLRSLVSGEGAL